MQRSIWCGKTEDSEPLKLGREDSFEGTEVLRGMRGVQLLEQGWALWMFWGGRVGVMLSGVQCHDVLEVSTRDVNRVCHGCHSLHVTSSWPARQARGFCAPSRTAFWPEPWLDKGVSCVDFPLVFTPL